MAWWNQDSQVRRDRDRRYLPLAQVTNGGKGWFGQGQGGCDYQFNMPLGSWSLPIVDRRVRRLGRRQHQGHEQQPAVVGAENNSSTWAVGGRAGYLVSPRFLTYFDGGFTQARFDQINYNVAGVGVLGGPTGISIPAQTYNGWFVGSGFEYAFDWLPIPGLFLKTEYRYAQYNTATPSVRSHGRRADRRFAQHDQVHPVRVDRTGLALQLVRRPLLIDAELLRQEPGTKVPGFLLR